MGGARPHTWGKDGLQAYPQICSVGRKTAVPIRLQCSNSHVVKHLAKSQANTWRPAKKRKGIVEFQTCVLQSAQELGYSCMKPAQVNVVLNFVRGRHLFANLPTCTLWQEPLLCMPAAFDAISKKERGNSIPW